MNNKIVSNKGYPLVGTAKRTALGSAMTFMGDAIRTLEHVILIPLFLWAWGSVIYGEWITLFSLISYFALSELGMEGYITNKMIQVYSRGDLKEYGKIFKSAFFLYLILITVGLGLILVTAFVLPLNDWFNIEITKKSTIQVTVLILGSYILLGVMSSPIAGLYISIGEFVRGKLVGNIKNFILIGFIALTLVFGGKFVSVAFLYLILLFLFLCFVFWDVTRRHKELELFKEKIDWLLVKSFIIPGLVFMLITLSYAIQIQGSVLIIGSVLGSVAVAAFAVHRTLANLVKRAVNIMVPALSPELTAGEARDDYTKLRVIHNMFLKIAIMLSVISVVFLFFTGEGIINIWTSGKIIFNGGLWNILLLSVPLYAIWHFSAVFQIATNKYTGYSVVSIISSLIGLGLALIFVHYWGIIGVVAGFMIPEILINLWWIPRRTTHIIKGRFKDYFYIFWVGGILAVILLTFGWLLSMVFVSWTKLFVLGIVMAAVGMAFTYFLWLKPQERKIVDNFINKTMSKIKKRTN